MNMNASRSCPVCSATVCLPLHEQRFILPEGHPLSDGYMVVSCESCGFVYADTGVGQQQFDDFYARFSKYEDAQTGTGTGLTAWDQKRLSDTAGEIARSVDRGARVLDLGCANGGLLAELERIGFSRLAGLDPSPACVGNTAALGFDCRLGCLPNLPSDLGAFDCVILSHVLEHVLDLRAAMKALSNIPMVYAEVPDAARYHRFLVAPFQDFNTEHINHFSSACLTNLFGQFGYERTDGGHKDIASSADSLTPAVFGFYRRTAAAPAPVLKDRDLREAIGLYISGSRRLLEEINSHLSQSLEGTPAVIIWGTGQLTMKLLCETVLGSHPIAAFVDGNPINQGKVIRGVRVLSPLELQRSGLMEPIVIGSLLHGQDIIAGIRQRYRLANALIELRPAVTSAR
jgi:SAM-dependent methyltransferase